MTVKALLYCKQNYIRQLTDLPATSDLRISPQAVFEFCYLTNTCGKRSWVTLMYSFKPKLINDNNLFVFKAKSRDLITKKEGKKEGKKERNKESKKEREKERKKERRKKRKKKRKKERKKEGKKEREKDRFPSFLFPRSFLTSSVKIIH